jgi:hypothetical protein
MLMLPLKSNPSTSPPLPPKGSILRGWIYIFWISLEALEIIFLISSNLLLFWLFFTIIGGFFIAGGLLA